LTSFGEERLDTDSEASLRLAAKLYYLDDLDQSQIADLLGMSRSSISRLLTRARKAGVVRISVDEYDPRDRELETRLREMFGLRHVVVVRNVDSSDPRQVRRLIGHVSAPVISQLIQTNTIVGVAGGRTLREMIQRMTATDEPRGITVVQLMGHVGSTAERVDAIEIGRTLTQRLGGTLCMLPAPAFAPDVHTRDAFLSVEQIRYVWQLYGAVHTALVGIGTLDDSVFIERGVVKPEEAEGLRQCGAIGEICGRFFDARGQECQTSFCERVLSIDLEELRSKPEVIGVTLGAERASAVSAAVTGGLLKSLVIDEAGARAILGVGSSNRSRPM
jgi:deoxyribonucleoside regulator